MHFKLADNATVPRPTVALIGLQDPVAFMLIETAERMCNSDVLSSLSYVRILLIDNY